MCGVMAGGGIHREVDLEIASYCHALAARPLLGVLDHDGDTVPWSSGGGDFLDVFPSDCERPSTLSTMLETLGVSDADISSIASTISSLSDARPLSGSKMIVQGAEQREYAIFFRCRDNRDEPLQFTLSDHSAFAKASEHHREMAKKVMSTLQSGWHPPLVSLSLIKEKFNSLENETDASEVTKSARKIAEHTDYLIAACVSILRQFENIDVHKFDAASMTTFDTHPISWQGIFDAVHQNKIAPSEISYAAEFIGNAIPVFIKAPSADDAIWVLNGRLAGTPYQDIASLIAGLEVGENSVHSARNFFSSLAEQASMETLAISGKNVEVRGRPLLNGGWQAVIAPAMTGAVDVRGFFHSFKNLLLHLQIFHVLHTPDDVDEVCEKLRDVFVRIDRRLEFLRQLADAGETHVKVHQETVAQWISDAKSVAHDDGHELDITISTEILSLAYSASPEEMGDTFAELTRNAFQNGAGGVKITAKKTKARVMFLFTDDGPGISDSKLAQIQKVLATSQHDPSLSTRVEGTGNGLRGAATAVRRFVDGRFDVERGSKEREAIFKISMALPTVSEEPSIFSDVDYVASSSAVTD